MATSDIMFIVVMSLGGILFLGAFIMIFMAWQKASRLRVRDPFSKKEYIRDFLCWERKDKITGIVWWQSVWWQKRIRVEEPPKDAIDITERGLKTAEAYRISEDQFVWIKDKGIKMQMNEVKDKDGKVKKVMQLMDIQPDGTSKVVDGFSPFTVVQRETIVNQYQKADAMGTKKWTADKIISMTAILGFVIIIIALMVFWGDLAKPVLEQGNANLVWQQNLLKLQQSTCNNNAAQQIGDQQQGGVISEGEKPPIQSVG